MLLRKNDDAVSGNDDNESDVKKFCPFRNHSLRVSHFSPCADYFFNEEIKGNDNGEKDKQMLVNDAHCVGCCFHISHSQKEAVIHLGYFSFISSAVMLFIGLVLGKFVL